MSLRLLTSAMKSHDITATQTNQSTEQKLNVIINNQFCLDYKIVSGGFGDVYAGHILGSDREVAVKLQRRDGWKHEDVKAEADVCRALFGGNGFPELIWCGQEEGYSILVHERLGPSLNNLFHYCKKRLSLKTVLMLADQAIARLAYMHRKGYLHGDIKLDNILMGNGKNANVAYPIDFGMAKRFDPEGASKTLTQFLGTPQYAPFAAHEFRPQSFADDLESLGYCLVHLATGSLPWAQEGGRDTAAYVVASYAMKKAVSSKSLCRGLPEEFVKYMDHLKRLRYGQMPNYSYLRRLFRNVCYARGFKHDYVYDWTDRLFEFYQTV